MKEGSELIFSVTKKDFHIDWLNGTKGGQNVNKNKTVCRITHIESGLTSIGQDHKSRVANQRDAFNRLAEKLVKHYGLDEKTVISEISNETIRTYHEPRNIVKDHASGLQQEYKYVVDNANVGDMLEARVKARSE